MYIRYEQPKNLNEFRAWWNAPSGYREVLKIAGPLVLSTGSVTIQQFVGRMFLAWYSDKAFAASLPAGMFSFMIFCFFLGTASYVNTFVAQYYGSGQHSKVAGAVWQAIYFSVAAGVVVLAFVPLAKTIFKLAGHEPELQILETQYFRILLYGGGFAVLSSAVSSFFTGLGKTWTVMYVNVAGTILNAFLEYALIFGAWGFPEMGIRGSAVATVIATGFIAIALLVIFLAGSHRAEYDTLRAWRFDPALFRRIMRYGAPSGLNFILDLLSFSLFIMLVGRLGTVELAASNLAFQVNTIAFLPMLGFATATATLVGQRLGESRPALAVRATWSAFHMTFIYMAAVAVLYIAVPSLFIGPFAAKADPKAFSSIYHMAIIVLRFVALYCIFDTMNLIFASALRGAGDTVFVLFLSVSLGMGLMVIPTWLICTFHGGIYGAWAALTAYVSILGLCFLWRFVKGGWRHLSIIEPTPEPSSVEITEIEASPAE